jgi:hypothetical protein
MLDGELHVEIIIIVELGGVVVVAVFVKLAVDLIADAFEEIRFYEVGGVKGGAASPQFQEELLQTIFYELAIAGEFGGISEQTAVMRAHQFLEAELVTAPEFVPQRDIRR